jgi:hypothetical protein
LRAGATSYPSHPITHGIITAPISNPDTSAKTVTTIIVEAETLTHASLPAAAKVLA